MSVTLFLLLWIHLDVYKFLVPPFLNNLTTLIPNQCHTEVNQEEAYLLCMRTS